jgi:hypothetical protein
MRVDRMSRILLLYAGPCYFVICGSGVATAALITLDPIVRGGNFGSCCSEKNLVTKYTKDKQVGTVHAVYSGLKTPFPEKWGIFVPPKDPLVFDKSTGTVDVGGFVFSLQPTIFFLDPIDIPLTAEFQPVHSPGDDPNFKDTIDAPVTIRTFPVVSKSAIVSSALGAAVLALPPGTATVISIVVDFTIKGFDPSMDIAITGAGITGADVGTFVPNNPPPQDIRGGNNSIEIGNFFVSADAQRGQQTMQKFTITFSNPNDPEDSSTPLSGYFTVNIVPEPATSITALSVFVLLFVFRRYALGRSLRQHSRSGSLDLTNLNCPRHKSTQ